MRSRILGSAALAALLLVGGASARADDGAAIDADPEGGAIHDGVYENRYFGVTVPLPAGWTQGLEGPPPSQSGYYVLASFEPAEALTATIMIAAQDSFFALKPAANAAEAVERFAGTMGGEGGLSLVHAPQEVAIGGRGFTRLDYEGAGLHHVLLATDRRCHVLIIVLTGQDAAALEELVGGLQAMQWADDEKDPVPLCLKDLPEAERRAQALSNVWALGGAPVAVRLVMGANGKVRHVHVIGAPAATAEMLTAVLASWTFEPYRQDGRAVAIETGVLIGMRKR